MIEKLIILELIFLFSLCSCDYKIFFLHSKIYFYIIINILVKYKIIIMIYI